ncbi:hypothetical protein WL76_27395 [Burkholderia ubonensis]|uniref:DUF4926 domain-containing protein n=1 Tax=Burkholderia ubonensis TaxID=101571 RepID=UPI000756C1DB|nr:DUF4926 domain-containing protein [Burkholderia ubonensis]KWD61418.1 hypothetical protein WL66_04170 [Burkholderia ubonensis]KWD70007.1 hypothetical protein WL67_24890 [Burkholderia ubonensis]KWE46827.1 hypothetical protein WL76_27395 [Burkholderia ubonensis]
MKISIYNRVRYIGQSNAQERIYPGDIGYVIEDYSDGNFEVEFSNPDGTTRAQVVVAGRDLELAEN